MQGLLYDEFHDEALTVFVKACATSAFCLESLEEVTQKLVFALNLVLHNHMRKYGRQPIPDVWCEACDRHCYALHIESYHNWNVPALICFFCLSCLFTTLMCEALCCSEASRPEP